MKIANQTNSLSNSRFEAVLSRALYLETKISFSRLLLTKEALKSAKGVVKRTLMGIDLFVAAKLSEQKDFSTYQAIRC